VEISSEGDQEEEEAKRNGKRKRKRNDMKARNFYNMKARISFRGHFLQRSPHLQ
jgi:hypothetical protein